MLSSAFELGEEMNSRVIRYILYKPIWDGFNYPTLDLSFSRWRSVKYLNDDATGLNENINMVPNNAGGLYLFYVKCSVIIGLTEYPLYIGRAQLTAEQNLRKRVKEYFQHYTRDNERPKITKMIKYWGKELFLAFYPLEENEDIINVEKDIINCTIFEMNDRIPDILISQATKAFNL
jgi:hypothetical protein